MRWGAPLLLLAAAPVAAHDFWIDVAHHHLAAPGEVELRFLIGEAAAPERWETLWRKIVSLRSYGPDGVADQQAGLHASLDSGAGGATIRLSEPGTHIIALETNDAENVLAAVPFEAYLAHEGLTPAQAKRRADGTTGMPGRELYSRRAKALVQVGSQPTDQVTRSIGQTLEIVLERNPYGRLQADMLPVRIRYHGQPLPGALVECVTLDPPWRAQSQRSDGQGLVHCAVAGRGRWRVSTVWTQPIVHPRADFETIFASLTFARP